MRGDERIPFTVIAAHLLLIDPCWLLYVDTLRYGKVRRTDERVCLITDFTLSSAATLCALHQLFPPSE